MIWCVWESQDVFSFIIIHYSQRKLGLNKHPLNNYKHINGIFQSIWTSVKASFFLSPDSEALYLKFHCLHYHASNNIYIGHSTDTLYLFQLKMQTDYV